MEENSHQTAAQKFAGIPATDDIARQLSGIQYPLQLSFKILALASQANVTDAAGRTVLHTKQKLFKFREHVEIFTDKTRATRSDGRPAMRIEKKAAFFEGRFEITKVGEMTPREELNLILSFMMLVMLERKRG